jgi:hypothetical protein
MPLSPEQALEEARKRYTEGTKYFWADSCYTVENNELFQIADYDNYWMIFSEPAKGVIYNSFTDTWAEIVGPPKTLQQKLVEDYGFEKRSFDHDEYTTHRYEKDGLSVDFDYLGEDLVNVDVLVKETFANNPDNLEAFIKSYLEILKTSK